MRWKPGPCSRSWRLPTSLPRFVLRGSCSAMDVAWLPPRRWSSQSDMACCSTRLGLRDEAEHARARTATPRCRDAYTPLAGTAKADRLKQLEPMHTTTPCRVAEEARLDRGPRRHGSRQ